jgi:ABC-type multidrug transport system fused ATPase/permease subunit
MMSDMNISAEEYTLLQKFRDGELNQEQAVLVKKLEALDKYMKLMKDVKEKENVVLGKLKSITKLPYPKQLMTIYLIALTGMVFFAAGPTIFYLLLSQFNTSLPSAVNMLYLSAFINCGGFIFVLILWSKCRGVIVPWLKAGLRNKPIVSLLTKNRTVTFMVPQDITENVWTLNDTLAAIPDPDAVMIGPNKVPLAFGIPEVGALFSPRSLAQGLGIGIDMTAIRQYAEMFDIRARVSMRSGMDAMKPYLGVIVIMFICGLVLLPIAYQMISQYNNGAKWQDTALRYHSQLVENHITPYDEVMKSPTKEAESAVATSTTMPPNERPASTGISVS